LNEPIGKPEGEREVEISKRKYKDNIEKDLKGTDCGLDSSGSG
jgi:hypothetical protein